MDASVVHRQSSHSGACSSGSALQRQTRVLGMHNLRFARLQTQTLTPLQPFNQFNQRPCNRGRQSLAVVKSQRRGPDYPGSGYNRQQQGQRGSKGGGWQQQSPSDLFQPGKVDLSKLIMPGLGALGLAVVAGPILGAMAFAGGIAATALLTAGGALFMAMGFFVPFLGLAMFLAVTGGLLGFFATVSAFILPAAIGMLALGAFGFYNTRQLKYNVNGSSSGFGPSSMGPSEPGVWDVEVDGEDVEERKWREAQEEDQRRAREELDDFDRLLRAREQRRSNGRGY